MFQRIKSAAVLLAAGLLLYAGTAIIPEVIQRNYANVLLMRLVQGQWCNEPLRDETLRRFSRLDPEQATWTPAETIDRLNVLHSQCTRQATSNADQVAAQRAEMEACRAQADWSCVAAQADAIAAQQPRHVAALFAQYESAEATGDADGARDAMARLVQLQPQVMLAAGPGASDWTLTGYDLDEYALAFEDRLDMTLYWQRQADSGTPTAVARLSADRVRVGDRILEVVSAHNLVLNGGFEQTARVHSGSPNGFPEDRYQSHSGSNAIPKGRRVAVAEREGAPTLCAELNNAAANSLTGLMSPQHPAEPGEQYLMGATVRDSGPGTRIGMLRLFPEDSLRNAYVPVQQSSARWTTFAGVLPVEGNTDTIRLQLLNQDEGHTLCVDNAFLMRVNAPDETRLHVGS